MVRIRAVLGGAIMQCKAGGWFRARVGADTRDSCSREEINSPRYRLYLTFTRACSALRTVVTVCTHICPGSQFFQGQTMGSITLLGFLKGLVGKSECVSVCMCV